MYLLCVRLRFCRPSLTALLSFYLALIIYTFCCSIVVFGWLSGEMGCGKSSWMPADKKGACSLLLLRKGTSVQTLHDSLHFTRELRRSTVVWTSKDLMLLITYACYFIHSHVFKEMNNLLTLSAIRAKILFFELLWHMNHALLRFFSLWEISREFTSTSSRLEPAGDWTAVLTHRGASVYFSAYRCCCASPENKKGQFEMIIKRLLSYGDGKCGVWHALARKSLDVTRGV